MATNYIPRAFAMCWGDIGISELLHATATYPVIEPISRGTDQDGPVVGVARVSAIKIGDDLLTGSQTADRPNGEKDEQLIESHSSVCLGNSATPSNSIMRSFNSRHQPFPSCSLSCMVSNAMSPLSTTSNTLTGLVAYSDDSQSDTEDNVASTSKSAGIGLANIHVSVTLPGFVQSFPSLLAVFLFGNRISH